MKILPSTLAAALFAALFFARCNPDCASLQNVQVLQKIVTPGEKLIITASPSSSLENKKVSFDGTEAMSEYREGLGLEVTVPPNISGDAVSITIEDLDCTETLEIFTNVKGAGYFDKLGTYSPPPPLDFIVPEFSDGIFPTSINNGWVNPAYPRHRLWFKIRQDTSINFLDPTKPVAGIFNTVLDPKGSFEFATCPCDRDANVPFKLNPIWGIVDKESNYIDITIDRRLVSNGADSTERFIGRFIDIGATQFSDVPEEVDCGDCGGAKRDDTAGGKPKHYMMLLTSQTTGRQLVVYQSDIGG